MKKTAIKTAFAAAITFIALACATSSCTDGRTKNNVVDPGHGTVSFRAMGVGVDPSDSPQSRAVDPSVDVSDYNVELINDESNTTVGAWSFSSMPDIQILPVGSYTVRVSSHAVKPAAWEEPLYAGSETFTIAEGEVYNVGTVVCTLSNIKVSVRYSDVLASMMDPASTVTVETGEGASLQFVSTESRSGYFEYVDGTSTLVATFSGVIEGQRETLRKVLTDVKPGHHYILTFTIKSGGFVAPVIALNATVDDEEITFTVEEDDDEILNSDDRPGGYGDDEPADEPITFTSSTLSFTKPNSTDLTEAIVLIHSDAAIEKLEVDIISATLTEEVLTDVGLASHFDLASPGDDELEKNLQGLGFKTGNDVKGQHDVVFNISNFVAMLKSFRSEHRFRVTVTDADGYTAVCDIVFGLD